MATTPGNEPINEPPPCAKVEDRNGPFWCQCTKPVNRYGRCGKCYKQIWIQGGKK